MPTTAEAANKIVRLVGLGGYHAMAIVMLQQHLWVAAGVLISGAWAFVVFIHGAERKLTTHLLGSLMHAETDLEQQVLVRRERAEKKHAHDAAVDHKVRIAYFQQSMQQRIRFLNDTEGTWTWLEHPQD